MLWTVVKMGVEATSRNRSFCYFLYGNKGVKIRLENEGYIFVRQLVFSMSKIESSSAFCDMKKVFEMIKPSLDQFQQMKTFTAFIAPRRQNLQQTIRRLHLIINSMLFKCYYFGNLWPH